jgi:hypothetical protein
MWLVFLPLLGAAPVSFALIMRSTGGWATYISTIGHQRITGIVGQGYLVMGVTLLSLPAVFLYAHSLYTRQASLRRLAYIVLVLYAPLALSIGYRSYFFYVVVWFALLHHYYVRRVRLGLGSVAAALLFLSALQVLAVLRVILQQGWDTGATVAFLVREPGLWLSVVPRKVQVFEKWYVTSGVLAPVLFRTEGIEILMRVIERLPWVGGMRLGWDTLVEWISTPIPRPFWPEKIAPVSYRFARTFLEERFTGTPLTCLGEFYWNFGVLGILGGMFLLGLFCKVVYVYFIGQRNPGAALLYAISFTAAVQMMEGPSNHANALLVRAAQFILVLVAIGRPAFPRANRQLTA